MPEQNTISLRSEAVQDIMGHVPSWMIRWGITAICAVVLVVLALSWFIAYPNIISGSVTITAQHPPIVLHAQAAGKVSQLLARDGETVSAGQLLAELEGPLSATELEALETLLPNIDRFLQQPGTLPVFPGGLTLGNLETPYATLREACTSWHQWRTSDYSHTRATQLQAQLAHYTQLTSIAATEVEVAQRGLVNAEQQYKAHQQLLADSMISRMDFFRQEALYNQQQLAVSTLKRTATQYSIELENLRAQLFEVEFKSREQELELQATIQTARNEIASAIESWRQGFGLVAPASGELAYLTPINTDQFAEAGTPLFAVIPPEMDVRALARVPVAAFSKVQPGQTALLQLSRYPAHEFGQVEGIVRKISAVPHEGFYTIEVSLPHGLQTSYQQQLEYSPGLAGSVSIITEDLRLLERVFQQLRRLMQR